MGGFFGVSSPAPRSAPAPVIMAPAAATTDPEAEARKARLEAVERNRRGRQGMVTTSERGLLEPVSGQTKTLLGE